MSLAGILLGRQLSQAPKPCSSTSSQRQAESASTRRQPHSHPAAVATANAAGPLLCDDERRLRPGAITNACLSEDDRATRRVIDAMSERETALALQNVSTTSAPIRMPTASQPKTRRPAPYTHRPDVTRTARASSHRTAQTAKQPNPRLVDKNSPCLGTGGRLAAATRATAVAAKEPSCER